MASTARRCRIAGRERVWVVFAHEEKLEVELTAWQRWRSVHAGQVKLNREKFVLF